MSAAEGVCLIIVESLCIKQEYTIQHFVSLTLTQNYNWYINKIWLLAKLSKKLNRTWCYSRVQTETQHPVHHYNKKKSRHTEGAKSSLIIIKTC